jgi:hypothetical protein
MKRKVKSKNKIEEIAEISYGVHNMVLQKIKLTYFKKQNKN